MKVANKSEWSFPCPSGFWISPLMPSKHRDDGYWSLLLWYSSPNKEQALWLSPVPTTQNHSTALVGRDLRRSSGQTFGGKGSLGEII